jgi:hypothetical protein
MLSNTFLSPLYSSSPLVIHTEFAITSVSPPIFFYGSWLARDSCSEKYCRTLCTIDTSMWGNSNRPSNKYVQRQFITHPTPNRQPTSSAAPLLCLCWVLIAPNLPSHKTPIIYQNIANKPLALLEQRQEFFRSRQLKLVHPIPLQPIQSCSSHIFRIVFETYFVHAVSLFIAASLAFCACATLKPPLKISIPNNIVVKTQVAQLIDEKIAAARADAQTVPRQ